MCPAVLPYGEGGVDGGDSAFVFPWPFNTECTKPWPDKIHLDQFQCVRVCSCNLVPLQQQQKKSKVENNVLKWGMFERTSHPIKYLQLYLLLRAKEHICSLATWSKWSAGQLIEPDSPLHVCSCIYSMFACIFVWFSCKDKSRDSILRGAHVPWCFWVDILIPTCMTVLKTLCSSFISIIIIIPPPSRTFLISFLTCPLFFFSAGLSTLLTLKSSFPLLLRIPEDLHHAYHQHLLAILL